MEHKHNYGDYGSGKGLTCTTCGHTTGGSGKKKSVAKGKALSAAKHKALSAAMSGKMMAKVDAPNSKGKDIKR